MQKHNLVKATVYSSMIKEEDISEDVRFASYIYLHGEAEKINGYDCCLGNIDFFHSLVRTEAFLVNVINIDGSIKLGICLKARRTNRDSNFIVFLDDKDGLKDIFKNLLSFPTMFEHELEIMGKRTKKYITDIIKDKNCGK